MEVLGDLLSTSKAPKYAAAARFGSCGENPRLGERPSESEGQGSVVPCLNVERVSVAYRAVPRVFILVYILHPSGGGVRQVRWTYSPSLGE